jgi:peptide/nickel transport system permease protein
MTAGAPPVLHRYPRLLVRPPRLSVAGVISVGVIFVAVAVALLANVIAPNDPNAVDFTHVLAGRSGQHLLGTDDTGRDLLSRLLVGSRTALLGPLIVVGVSAAVGSTIAICAAWLRGFGDAVISRLIDLLFAFPGLLLAILATAIFGPSLLTAALALSVSYVPYTARLVRSEALRQLRLPYIESSWVQGVPTRRILGGHLLPGLLPLIVAQTTVSFGYAMIDVAALSYLGLGVQPPTPDWGTMVASGQTNIVTGHPQESLYAGLCIVLVVIAFTTTGDLIGGWARRSERAA